VRGAAGVANDLTPLPEAIIMSPKQQRKFHGIRRSPRRNRDAGRWVREGYQESEARKDERPRSSPPGLPPT